MRCSLVLSIARTFGVLVVSPFLLRDLAAIASADDTIVIYVNKYFEVRENEAPTKYVWNGDARVGKAAGSLSNNRRLQRFRLFPGWNLCSFAVTAPNALLQLTTRRGKANIALNAAFKWHSTSSAWVPMTLNET